jgi:hypothetical protein
MKDKERRKNLAQKCKRMEIRNRKEIIKRRR